MSIITKRGDEGETDLLFGRKAAKTDARIEALGAVDELNAHLGLARLHATEQDLLQWIDTLQANLINLMGEVATHPEDLEKYREKGYTQVTQEDLQNQETIAKEYEDSGNTFRGWLRPGADHSQLSAQLHVCRTVCRRAERRLWDIQPTPKMPCLFLNRIADLLWLIANESNPQAK